MLQETLEMNDHRKDRLFLDESKAFQVSKLVVRASFN